jgi:hypothetical protein
MPMSVAAYSALQYHLSHTSTGPGEPMLNIRHNNRDTQTLGDARKLYFADSGAAVIPGIGGETCPLHGGYGEWSE